MKKILIAVAIFLAAARASAQLPQIDYTEAPYHHNMQRGYPCLYSGHLIFCTHQWGVYQLNTNVQGGFTMISAVGKIDPLFQSPKIAITGDCWQSSTRVAVTPYTPKWVVSIGTPPNCDQTGQPVPAQEVQVYRADGPQGFRWVGQIDAPQVVGTNAPLIIDGDYAFAPEGIFPATHWTKVDLNALAVVQAGVTNPPTQVVQPDIGGYTYSIQQITQQQFRAVRSGAVTPTPAVTPSPTPVPTPDPAAAWIENLFVEGITAGCGGGNYCPDAPVTRRQMAVYLLKAKYGASYLPPACVGVFNDVPCK